MVSKSKWKIEPMIIFDDLLDKTSIKYMFALSLSYRGGGGEYAPLLFFLHHPKTALSIKLKLSDFKDTLLRHILKVKPVR